jgi:hypothetical protein
MPRAYTAFCRHPSLVALKQIGARRIDGAVVSGRRYLLGCDGTGARVNW